MCAGPQPPDMAVAFNSGLLQQACVGHRSMPSLQEVEYVKAEDKLARIGECLQKTAPPVLIFAERTRDVDMVHEYLLMKGVNAVAIHGAAPVRVRAARATCCTLFVSLYCVVRRSRAWRTRKGMCDMPWPDYPTLTTRCCMQLAS